MSKYIFRVQLLLTSEEIVQKDEGKSTDIFFLFFLLKVKLNVYIYCAIWNYVFIMTKISRTDYWD